MPKTKLKATGPPTPTASKEVRKLVEAHREILIIFIDPKTHVESESNVAVYSKMLDKGSVLAPYLTRVIQNLLRMRNGKQPHYRKGKATTRP